MDIPMTGFLKIGSPDFGGRLAEETASCQIDRNEKRAGRLTPARFRLARYLFGEK
jgi:hypothetical protein